MTNQIPKHGLWQLKLVQCAVMFMIPSIAVPLVYFSDTSRSQVKQGTIHNATNSTNVKSSNPLVPKPLTQSSSLPSSIEPLRSPPQLAYNVKNAPVLLTSASLQAVVNDVVKTIEVKGLPIDKLSISVINLQDSRCAAYAGFQDHQPRFPASVSKLFWMVALLGQMHQKVIPENAVTERQIYKMIQKSDNETASLVVDRLTNTESGANLPLAEFKSWLDQRYSLNRFFESAGYQAVNISQKNFPIPYLKLQQATGRDLQMRGGSKKSIRNSLTTYETTRLMYEIHTDQAISPQDSDLMESMMKRDLRPEIWKQEQYNSIDGFLGEFLPLDTYFASKVGWTSNSRQDTAIIRSADGTVHYILTVFGDDKAYADDWEIFPQVSRQIFDQLKNQPVSCQSIS
ncbi:MAG: class A beta-lactamase-related serine hydrolase [Leptolyngbya sp. Prado105]|jgi:hypothetical protein|nr:class A beta-lactamase-related serine hydrolase [Leptolyngbya sp. Prado105]